MPTTGPGAAAHMAREAVDRGADLILAAGGDGTINEIVNGMAGSNVPLGILPAGTANVLANEFGIGMSMERAAKSLLQSVPERVSLGLLSTALGDAPRYFLLMAGAGLDAEIVYHLNGGLKDAAGESRVLGGWLGEVRAPVAGVHGGNREWRLPGEFRAGEPRAQLRW